MGLLRPSSILLVACIALAFLSPTRAQDLPHLDSDGSSFERYIGPDGEIPVDALDFLPEHERELFERVDDGRRVFHRLKGAVPRQSAASAELVGVWDTFDGGFGLLASGDIWALAPGPGESVYVGGRFSELPDGTPAGNVAVLDGATWSSLGGGLPTTGYSTVTQLVVLPDGRLVAAGSFDDGLGNIAVWDGATWSALGGGLSGSVIELTIDAAGTLYAVGGFRYTRDGSVTLNHVAVFDGDTWQPFSRGFTNPPSEIAVLDDGTVVVSGYQLADAGSGVSLPGVARWTGEEWVELGEPAGLSRGALHVGESGRLYYAGDLGLYDDAGAYVHGRIGVWDGQAWSHLHTSGTSPDFTQSIYRGTFIEHGEYLYLMGYVYYDYLYQELGVLSRLDLATGEWDYVVGVDGVKAVAFGSAVVGDRLVIAGEKSTAGGAFKAAFVAEFDGLDAVASRPVPGTYRSGGVSELARDPEGRLLVAGSFTSTFDQSIALNGIARWSGTAWEPMASGFPYPVRNVVSDDEGIYVAVINEGVFEWTGTDWLRLGERLTQVYALGLAPDGTLYAGGEMYGESPVWRLDGGSWTSLPGLSGATVRDLDVGLDGTLYVGGSYLGSDGGARQAVAAWDGGTWVPLGGGLGRAGGGVPFVNDLDVGPDGRLVVGGGFDRASGLSTNGIAVWDGTGWSALGAGFNTAVFTVEFGPEGDVFAGGSFAYSGSTYTGPAAWWDGTTWRQVGGEEFSAAATTADFGPSGELVIGGAFNAVSGVGPANGIVAYLGSATPDLAPTGLSVSPETATPGATVTVSFAVVNQGYAAASSSVADVRLSTSNQLPSSSDPLLAQVSVPDLTVGASFDGSLEVDLPNDLSAGAYHLWVTVDATGVAGQTSGNLDNDATSVALGLSTAEETGGDVPSRPLLAAPRPNPAIQSAAIRFGVPDAEPVQVHLLDVTGRHIAVLVDGSVARGWHTVGVDLGALADGVYLVRLQHGVTVLTRTLSVVH